VRNASLIDVGQTTTTSYKARAQSQNGLCPMKAVIIPSPVQQNCSVLWCEETNKAAVVDPGGEIERIEEAIDEQGVDVEKIMLTHGHIDHAGGAADLSEKLGIPIEGPHPDDTFLIEKLHEQGAQFGVEGGKPFTPHPLAGSGRQSDGRQPHI